MAERTKKSVDYTRGPLFIPMIKFVIPVLFSNMFQQLYNTVDTMVIGHTLGETSLAAIGAATAIYDVLTGFAFGIGNGFSIVAARSYGSGEISRLKKSVASSIMAGLTVVVLITVVAFCTLMPFLRILNTPENIIAESYAYISVIVFFIGIMFLYNLCAGLLRAIGNSFAPLVFLIFSSFLNIILDVVFIRYWHMGIRGAAVATVIAQGCSVVLCLLYIWKKVKILIPQRSDFALDKNLYKETITQGLALGFMECIVYAGGAVLQSAINSLGYLIVAGHTAARRLFQAFLMPCSAMSATVNVFVSQNRGADKVERIRKIMRYAYMNNAVMTLIITGIVFLFSDTLVFLISGSREAIIINNASLYLRVAAPCYLLLSILGNTRAALQAIGRKILPVLSSVIELFGKIIFAMFLIPKLHYFAVVICEPIIWCFMLIELLTAFWLNPYIRQKREYEGREEQ